MGWLWLIPTLTSAANMTAAGISKTNSDLQNKHSMLDNLTRELDSVRAAIKDYERMIEGQVQLASFGGTSVNDSGKEALEIEENNIEEQIANV